MSFPNLEQDIARMVNTPGIYLVTDSLNVGHPLEGGRLVTVVLSCNGKLTELLPANQLDPNRFFETAQIHGPVKIHIP